MKAKILFPMRHHASTIVLVIMLITIILMAFLNTACSSNSGRLTVSPEKIVILDSSPMRRNANNVLVEDYKVRRIDKGVVTYIRIIGDQIYEKGDTILWKFVI